MKIKQLIINSQKQQIPIQKHPINTKKITQLGCYASINQKIQLFKKDDKINNNYSFKQLEKQNFRLIESNLKLLTESIEIITAIREDLLRVLLFMTEGHYNDATKAVYQLINKTQQFKQNHQCPSINNSKYYTNHRISNPESSKLIFEKRERKLCSTINQVINPSKLPSFKLKQISRSSLSSEDEQSKIQNTPIAYNSKFNTSGNKQISNKFENGNEIDQKDNHKKLSLNKNKNQSQIQADELYRLLLCQSISLQNKL